MSYDFIIFGPPLPETCDEALAALSEAADGDWAEAPTRELGDYLGILAERWPGLEVPGSAGGGHSVDQESGATYVEFGPAANMLMLSCPFFAPQRERNLEAVAFPAISEALKRGLTMLNPQEHRYFALDSLPDGTGPRSS